jgi:hypothetical protein
MLIKKIDLTMFLQPPCWDGDISYHHLIVTSVQMYSIQHYVIKFVCDLQQVVGVLCNSIQFNFLTIKLDIIRILLIEALNPITHKDGSNSVNNFRLMMVA